MKKIFRDDDIGETTNVARFVLIDNFFKKYNVQHTIAVIVNGLENNTELISYIRENPHILVQVHGWDHLDYSTDSNLTFKHLVRSKKKLKELFGKEPTIWYPPWNRVTDESILTAKEAGFKTSWEKASLSYYVQNGGNIEYEVLNFHYWADQDTQFLEPALKIYTKSL